MSTTNDTQNKDTQVFERLCIKNRNALVGIYVYEKTITRRKSIPLYYKVMHLKMHRTLLDNMVF
uniref:Uncharacterized protein n=1 Tax=Megaviridae environmental sample TaxID=1737588 RepID=A0A5J6VLX6_9VIRU|nr:MAG: hypothetical protein [Megaviridae environmental sample]